MPKAGKVVLPRSLPVFALSQNPSVLKCWTTALGAFPTFTHGGTPRLWLPSQERWLTSAAKLALMGIPIHPQLATAAGVPLLDLQKWDADFRHLGKMPGLHLHGLAGNGMVCGVVGIVLASVLSCVRFRPTEPPLPPPAVGPIDEPPAFPDIIPEAERGINFSKAKQAWIFDLHGAVQLFAINDFGSSVAAFAKAKQAKQAAATLLETLGRCSVLLLRGLCRTRCVGQLGTKDEIVFRLVQCSLELGDDLLEQTVEALASKIDPKDLKKPSASGSKSTKARPLFAVTLHCRV